MNVTLKLPDDLCQEARHRAVDERKSLSAWLTSLVERELNSPVPPKSLLELLGQDDIPPEDLGKELPLEDRKAMKAREFTFEPDED